MVLSEFSSERQGAELAPTADSPALDAEGGYGEEGVKEGGRGGRSSEPQSWAWGSAGWTRLAFPHRGGDQRHVPPQSGEGGLALGENPFSPLK